MKIWFEEEERPYTVQANNDRFLICTKPFNLKHTVLYTIVDLQENIRGADNDILEHGYESVEDCEDALKMLINGELEVSRWKRIKLNISWCTQTFIMCPTRLSDIKPNTNGRYYTKKALDKAFGTLKKKLVVLPIYVGNDPNEAIGRMIEVKRKKDGSVVGTMVVPDLMDLLRGAKKKG